MAMTVTNKFTSINFLNLLDRTGTRLDKSLIKISSGQKINSAADNASDYAISERMRGQLRSLNQTDQNVQNGLSMLKVAEGGVQRIVDVLRDMKNLAINSANDSNTNADRQIMQYELTKGLATINNIAISTKYNNKGLIDGTFDINATFEEEIVVTEKLNQTNLLLSPNEDYTKELYIDGSRVVIGENKVKNLAQGFKATTSSVTLSDGNTSENSGGSSTSSLTALTKPNMKADIGFTGSSSTWNWGNAYRSKVLSSGEALVSTYYVVPTTYETGVEIDFGAAQNVSGSTPDAFHDQGFSILCGGCPQYINIVFDKTMNIGQGTLKTYSNDTYKKDYRVGIGDATSEADLARAIFEGIANASGRSKMRDVSVLHANGTTELVCVSVDPTHNLRIAKDPNDTSKYLFLKTTSPAILFLDSGTILATGGTSSHDNLPQGTVTQVASGGQPEIQTINVNEYTSAQIWEDEESHLETVTRQGEPLVIHDGTQSGEYNSYLIKNMQTKALGFANIFDADGEFLNMRDRARYEALSEHPDEQESFLAELQASANLAGSEISIATAKDAKVAIGILDEALNYALDNATKIGSYLQRMESMENTIYTMEENTEASKSVIRDSDISKEIIAYTKSNVLSQSVQFMLAQSNNNSFMVLNLLR